MRSAVAYLFYFVICCGNDITGTVRYYACTDTDADAVPVSRAVTRARAPLSPPRRLRWCRKLDAFFDASFVRRRDTSGRNATEE